MKENHAVEVLRLKEQYSLNLAQLIENHKEEIHKIKVGEMSEGFEKEIDIDNSAVSLKIGVKERYHNINIFTRYTTYKLYKNNIFYLQYIYNFSF